MPNRALAKRRDLARRFLTYETAVGPFQTGRDTPAFRACEKLRGPLSKLVGGAGFHSLLSRALTLAEAKAPCLRSFKVEPDGSLAAAPDANAQIDARAVAEGEIVLVSQLLGLLETFIGPALTLQVLRGIWPKMNDLKF